MLEGIISLGMWAFTGGGGPFMWTATVIGGTPGHDCLMEATLAKIVLPSGSGHAKASIWGWTDSGGNSWNPGIDGSPIVSVPGGVQYMTFALEVQGSNTFANMIGKLYIF
jgi:hypothetical protein